MPFKPTVPRIFIDPDTPVLMPGGRADIILSPAFYWIRFVELPVKTLRDVRSIMPGVFEEMLPEGVYRYQAQRSGTGYLIVAYEPQKIRDQLHAMGVGTSQINHCYLAQEAFASLDGAMCIDGENVLLNHEGIVIRVPSSLVDQSAPLQLQADMRLSGRIDLGGSGEQSGLGVWGGVLAAGMIGLIGFKWWMVSDQNRRLSAERDALERSYALRPTMLQNNAVLAALEKRFSVQQMMRDALARVLALELKREERVERVSGRIDGLNAVIGNVSQARKQAIQSQWSTWPYSIVHTYADGQLRLKVSW